MSVTCEQVAALLAAGGKAALIDRDVQDHIGGCEDCAERVIELDESPPPSDTAEAPSLDLALPPAPDPPPLADLSAPEGPEPAVESSVHGGTPDEAGVPGNALADTEAPLTTPSPSPQEWLEGGTPEVTAPPPRSTPPPRASQAPAAPEPQAPAAPEPQQPAAPPQQDASWLPTELPPPAPDSPVFGERRSTLRIKMKPTTLWLGALTSAIAGGLVVAVVVITLRGSSAPESPPPQPQGALAEAQGGEVPPNLVPVFSVAEGDAEEREVTAAPERKSKRKKRTKRKGKADETAPPPATKLTTAQISTGIKSNLASLGPCFKAARKRNEMSPGKHQLVIDFRIQPDGSTREAILTGPAYLANKRVAKCMANKVRAWRFPPSSQGSPVRNLQLPVVVK